MADIRFNDALQRYELRVGGEIAVTAKVTDSGDTVAITSTTTEERFGGKGLGTELVAFALADIRDRGKNVDPVCPFVRHVLNTRDEFADLR